jgi:hypothetical protein
VIELEKLTPFGRKQWTKRKFDEYSNDLVTKAIERSERAYSQPTHKDFDDHIDKSKWKTTIDKKVNYLLARKPLLTGEQDKLDSLLDFIKESAKQYLLRGSLIWIVQGDGENIEPSPLIMNNTIAVYTDESKETPVAFIRKYVDTVLEEQTGDEKEITYYELYYGTKRDTYCYENSEYDKIGEDLKEAPLFIELGKTGDSPLFAYVEKMLGAFDNILKHQDTTTQKNTDPLVEVRGYSGTDDADLSYAVNKLKIARTDGTGGVTIHTRSMDSNSIDIWEKRLMNEYYEATCTVGKDNELQYAQSGKAMDRLFIDMENSARELAHTLESALAVYFDKIGMPGIDIVWNTDRPVDDATIINGIAQSVGILSEKTLIEQHPWVDDVDEELRRKAAEGLDGMSDLTEGIEEEEELDGSID